MKYALANSLSTSVSGLDPDAKAYIDAVVAAGATVTATQKNAINVFVKTGKGDDWWSSIKRFYLPIWAIAAPNAIDMVSLASGTYNGTVTHSAGYVVGDGSTGYFAIDDTNSALGLVPSTGSMFALRTNVSLSKRIIGTIANGLQRTFVLANVGSVIGEYITGSGTFTGPSGCDASGILLISRTSGVTTTYFRSASNQASSASTYADVGVAATSVMHVMSLNGSSTSRDSSRYGAFGCGTGMDSTKATSFTLSVKNLWEDSTGLNI